MSSKFHPPLPPPNADFIYTIIHLSVSSTPQNSWHKRTHEKQKIYFESMQNDKMLVIQTQFHETELPTKDTNNQIHLQAFWMPCLKITEEGREEHYNHWMFSSLIHLLTVFSGLSTISHIQFTFTDLPVDPWNVWNLSKITDDGNAEVISNSDPIRSSLNISTLYKSTRGKTWWSIISTI